MYFPKIADRAKIPKFSIDFKYLNLFEKQCQLHVIRPTVGNACSHWEKNSPNREEKHPRFSKKSFWPFSGNTQLQKLQIGSSTCFPCFSQVYKAENAVFDENGVYANVKYIKAYAIK